MPTKYSDLEAGETTTLTTKDKVPETKVKGTKAQETCWWCLVLCPIVTGIIIIILLILFIMDQYHQKKINEEDFNNIWLILAFILLSICSLVYICQCLKLVLGYMCYPGTSDKKDVQLAKV